MQIALCVKQILKPRDKLILLHGKSQGYLRTPGRTLRPLRSG